MNARRTGAFREDRSDVPDLSADLPPAAWPATPPVPLPTPATSPPKPVLIDASAAPQDPAPAKPRRPTKQTSTEEDTAGPGAKMVGARIPKPLYDALLEQLTHQTPRPSYAQLVTWACEDHPAEVTDGTRRALGVDRDPRAPRGSRRASDTIAVTLRFWPEELAIVDALQARIQAPRGVRVTRTAVIVAALQESISLRP